MGEIGYTRNLFLRGISVIYMFAFISFYVQIPGLYGNNGILPARTQLQEPGLRTLSEKLHKKPTLLWLAPILGLNTEYMMDVLSLLGVVLSSCGFISQRFCTAPIFAVLWSLYFSLYQVGQTFMWFQWDILLLEVGFLTILVAPWKFQFNSKHKQQQPISTATDNVTFFLVRWLLFRFMFASGVVKLQSGCPTWWGLTALNVHFESQPLPTVLAWYMHHMPNWFLKLGTVYTHIVEQIMPFLFFFPNEISSGNWIFSSSFSASLHNHISQNYFFKKVVNVAVNIHVHAFILFIAMVYYSVRLTPKWTIESDITFSKAEFDQFIKRAVPAGIYIGGVTLLIMSIQAIYNSFKGAHVKISTILVTLIYVSAAFFLFGISLVPYSVLHKSSNSTILPPLRKIYNRLEYLQIANSYGLFRRMTGVGGRPEVIIEGANDLKGPWLEYHFKYKPGDVNASMHFVAPYQPRLDWQMWFAALGTYHQNPWLMSTAYKILEGEKTVLQLMDMKRLPFSKAPKYLKASLYHYHYTTWTQRKYPTWWKRENVGEYFPILSKDQPSLLDYLKGLKIIDTKENIAADNKLVLPWTKFLLDNLRNTLGQIDPVLLSWSIFTAYIVFSATAAFTSNTTSNSHKKKA